MLYCNNCKYFFAQNDNPSNGTCVKRMAYILQTGCANTCMDYADNKHSYLIENVLDYINELKRNVCSAYNDEHEKCPFFQRHKDYNDCTFHFFMKALLEIKGVKEMKPDD